MSIVTPKYDDGILPIVLFVEDDKEFIDFNMSFSNRHTDKFVAYHAACTADALNLLETDSKRIMVVSTDMRLPDVMGGVIKVRGIDLAITIRAHFPHITCLAVSSDFWGLEEGLNKIGVPMFEKLQDRSAIIDALPTPESVSKITKHATEAIELTQR